MIFSTHMLQTVYNHFNVTYMFVFFLYCIYMYVHVIIAFNPTAGYNRAIKHILVYSVTVALL